ncbi:HD domain-containing protein [Candidatus Neomarinimicrobiota bacterium]
MLHKYLDNRRSLRDRVHGTICLTEEEIQIIDTPLFRRLLGIRQNGLLYLVFPTATHTRFEHSIGALYCADLILTNMIYNAMVAFSKPTKAIALPERAKKGQAIGFNQLKGDELRFIFRTARIAALVHDLGHGPFSHTFGPFAPHVSSIVELINGEEKLRPISEMMKLLEDKNGDSQSADRIQHEYMSCILFACIWNDLESGGRVEKDDHLPCDVAAVLLNKPSMCKRTTFREYIPLIRDIVASAPADSDRMDYLLRDSQSVGVSYGNYDKARLLKSFLAYKTVDDSGEVIYRLGIKRSGLRAVENFLQARFEMRVQIYFHKTSHAVELMLSAIAKRTSKLHNDILSFIDLNGLCDMYIKLSDERFLQVLRGKDPEWELNDGAINEIANNVFNRVLWKRIYEGTRYGDLNVNEIYKNLEESFADYPIMKSDIQPKATKDLHKGAILLERDAKGIYAKPDHLDWLTESEIIEALAKQERNIVRIYLSDSDGNKAKKLREAIFKLSHELAKAN